MLQDYAMHPSMMATNTAGSTTTAHNDPKRIMDIFEDEDLTFEFVSHCIISVVTKTTWKSKGTIKLWHQVASVHDEAFALLSLENNAARWVDSAHNPSKKKNELVKPLYTEVGGARRRRGAAGRSMLQGGGAPSTDRNTGAKWQKGEDRFVELLGLVMERRKTIEKHVEGSQMRKIAENVRLKALMIKEKIPPGSITTEGLQGLLTEREDNEDKEEQQRIRHGHKGKLSKDVLTDVFFGEDVEYLVPV